jgi:hypothetical protein
MNQKLQVEFETMSKSEVARLRQMIADEYTSAQQGLHGYAAVAKHEIITHRFNRVGELTDQLAQFVGEQEALQASVQIYMQVTGDGTTQEDHAGACDTGQAPALQTPQEEPGRGVPLKVDPCEPVYVEGARVEEEIITVKAYLKSEGVQFLRDRACHVEQYPTGDLVTFPAGSHKTKLSPVSRCCSTITLPDATEITSIDDGNIPSILLLIDIAKSQTIHLTY